jgi:hypothetical protein
MTKKLILSSILAIFIFGIIVLIASAQTDTGTTGNKDLKNIIKTVDLPCMQTATQTRDTAIISAWTKLTSAVKTALTTRQSALKEAWAITDKTQRIAAIKKAWTDYKTAIKSARTTWAKDKKAAWQQFKTDAKNCRGNAEDKTSESIDNSL